MMFGVNTSIPPPPIINLPKRISPPTLMETTNPDVSFFSYEFMIMVYY